MPKRPIGRTIIYYQFYKARGRADGHELEDWLQAEVELAQTSMNPPHDLSIVIPSMYVADFELDDTP